MQLNHIFFVIFLQLHFISYIRVMSQKFFLFQLINIVMWVISLLTLLAVALTQRATEIDNGYELHAYQEELKRPFWAAGVAWIIYSSYYGYGGKSIILNQVLPRLRL